MAKMIFIGRGVFKYVSSNNQNYYIIIINWAEFDQVKVSMNEKKEGDFSSNIFILKIKYFLEAFIRCNKFLVTSTIIV
jgi:hypothetical protein